MALSPGYQKENLRPGRWGGKMGRQSPNLSVTPDAARGLSSLPLSHPCSSPALGTDLPIVIADDLGGRLLYAAPSRLFPLLLCQVGPSTSQPPTLSSDPTPNRLTLPVPCYLVLGAGWRNCRPSPEPSLGKPQPASGCGSSSTSEAKERTGGPGAPWKEPVAKEQHGVSILPTPALCPRPTVFFGLASGDTLSQGRKARTISHNSRGRVCVVDHIHGATWSCAIQWP